MKKITTNVALYLHINIQVEDTFKNLPVIRRLQQNINTKESQQMVFKIFLDQEQHIRYIRDTLEIPYIATKRLQKSQITLSDAYLMVLSAREQLRNIGIQSANTLMENDCDIRSKLVSNIESRLKSLQNPFTNAAVFLDPRIKSVITSDTKLTDDAIALCVEIWRNIRTIFDKGQQKTQPINQHGDINQANHERSKNETQSLAMFLGPINVTSSSSSSIWDDTLVNYDKSIGDIISMLRSYQREDPIASKDIIVEDVNFLMKYWGDRRKNYPELFEIIRFVSNIPPTQVKVERMFSSLSYIFSDRRCRLSQKMLECILTIKLNETRAIEIFKTEMAGL